MLPACADNPAICCDRPNGFHAVAERLLTTAHLAVLNCIGEELCKDFSARITHAEPIGTGDYVAVWLASVTPQISQQNRAAAILITTIRYTYGIAVCQAGYPGLKTIGGEISTVPSDDEYNHVAPYDYALAEAVYRAILGDITGQQLTGCNFASITRLIPEAPQNYSARWRFDVALDANP